jgi:hypothetical protein
VTARFVALGSSPPGLALLLAVLLAGGGAMAGCGPAPTTDPIATPAATPAATDPSTDEPGGPVEARTRQGSFTLVLRVDQQRHAPGEPIAVRAALEYDGPLARASLVGSGSGLVLFGIRLVDGPIEVTPAATADCVPYTIERGQPHVAPFAKSGGFSNDDPNALFYREFFAHPQLRLPVGRWVITALARFFVGECGMDPRELSVEVEILVE